MPPISLLIKPASGACNLRCRYCFYADEMANRETAIKGMMSEETLENVVKKTMAEAEYSAHFGFQGGEPTLAGLPFFRKLHELTDRYNTKGLKVTYSIQTNGIVLDDEWASFFKDHGYLVGLSLDGPKDVHNKNRKNPQGEGTYERVIAAAELLERHGVEYNILCVITSMTAKNIDKIYTFFKKRGLVWQQYIPCLDPLDEAPGGEDYSLTPAQYGQFLKKLFDLWYEDIVHGTFVYNRTFENWVGMLRGVPPEACGMMGRCALQHIVEADGSVYPCDFYVLDDYLLGNLNTDSFAELARKYDEMGFVQQSMQVHEDCRVCPYYALCRGGCRRYREPMLGDGRLQKSFFCRSYRDFFAYAIPRLQKLAEGAR